MSAPTVVLKFGSSVLRDGADLSVAVHEVYRHVRRGARVVAVVSALGGTTDSLTRDAERVGDTRAKHAVAALLATGEAHSAALLVLALERAGLPSRVLEPHRVGLIAAGDALDAIPVALDVEALERAFDTARVLVLPGFFGRAQDGELALFGRGGSDLTALFVAHHARAHTCRLVKDVEGLYDRDPALPGPPPERFANVSWSDALALGGAILQRKALLFAREHELEFEVGGPGGARTTLVGQGPTVRVVGAPYPVRPLRIALLGLGTVGAGTYRELAARPDLFTVTAILVRDRSRPRAIDVGTLLMESIEDVLASAPDVVVELAGGTQPAADWIEASLASGCDVVTANKAVLAERGCALEARARRCGVRLLSSASVGGGLPALEQARRLGRRDLVAIEGVLNGTSNYVLERLAEGVAFDAAVRSAQAAGYAEADPTLDLDGTDAAQKIELLARAAFGADVDLHWTERRGIGDLTPEAVCHAGANGRSLRLVATCQRTQAGVVLAVAPQTLHASDPLACTRDEDNALRFTFADGSEERLLGKGAGCWPTTESVLADLLDLARSHARLAPRRVAV